MPERACTCSWSVSVAFDRSSHILPHLIAQAYAPPYAQVLASLQGQRNAED